jgi:hypothetical protein
MALFAAQVRGGYLEQGEGADRDEDHPDAVHVRMVHTRSPGRNRANVLSWSRPDDVAGGCADWGADSRP